MVFKVKKRAAINYWATTKDSDDGAISTGGRSLMYQDLMALKANSFINPLGYEYSYNWPYDNFSLIELAQVEVGNNFGRRPPPPGPTTVATPANPLATEAAADNVTAAPARPSVTTAAPGQTGGAFTADNARRRAAASSRTTTPANRSKTGGGFSTE